MLIENKIDMSDRQKRQGSCILPDQISFEDTNSSSLFPSLPDIIALDEPHPFSLPPVKEDLRACYHVLHHHTIHSWSFLGMALNVKINTEVYTRAKEKSCVVGCFKNGSQRSPSLGVHALA